MCIIGVSDAPACVDRVFVIPYLSISTNLCDKWVIQYKTNPLQWNKCSFIFENNAAHTMLVKNISQYNTSRIHSQMVTHKKCIMFCDTQVYMLTYPKCTLTYTGMVMYGTKYNIQQWVCDATYAGIGNVKRRSHQHTFTFLPPWMSIWPFLTAFSSQCYSDHHVIWSLCESDSRG